MKEVLDFLDRLNIEYNIVNHPPIFTCDEGDKYVEGMEGVFTKSLFLAGKKDRNYYLFIMDENRRLDIKAISEVVGDKLHFAKEEDLSNKLGLYPGGVSLFGLLNNKEHDVKVYIDENIKNEEIITFHPNDNSATLFFKIEDMYKVLKELDYDYKFI